MAKHNNTGTLGEELAEGHLSKNGFVILAKNWRYSRWEVDIIAVKKEVLHFIEVKTRRSKNYGLPEEKVTNKKIQNLINASEEYLHLNPQWKRIQFDILSVYIDKNNEADFFLIEDVYL